MIGLKIPSFGYQTSLPNESLYSLSLGIRLNKWWCFIFTQRSECCFKECKAGASSNVGHTVSKCGILKPPLLQCLIIWDNLTQIITETDQEPSICTTKQSKLPIMFCLQEPQVLLLDISWKMSLFWFLNRACTYFKLGQSFVNWLFQCKVSFKACMNNNSKN